MITVFTPTYNRSHTLTRLYRSLCEQTSKEFIWLIVDDGSMDNTKELVTTWISEKKIAINYYYQENMGKSGAHNKGVELAETELFVCVDSDDYLANDAIEEIIFAWSNLKATKVIGILAFRGYADGDAITTYSLSKETTGQLLDLYRHKIISGDTMLIYRTELMKEFRFPIFENEKFVPEAYLYDKLDEKGELYVLPKVLYIGEYLADGYTQNMAKLIANNPKGYLAWIRQRLSKDRELKYKVMDTIRYISISIVGGSHKTVTDSLYPIMTFLLYPFGWLFFFHRYYKFIKK